MKSILLTGQCTLHLGRMEFGNLGNYAIIEPFIRELHRVFPKAEINTTFQMTKEFCQQERVKRLSMDLYYSWKKNDLIKAIYETVISSLFKKKLFDIFFTNYMKEVKNADLVIDFSGDIWGENANLIGKHRFLVGLLKDLTAYNLGKKIVMLAGSPGPFKGFIKTKIAKYIFEKFDLVTNREELSTKLLELNFFNLRKVHNLACPAFLFLARPENEMKRIFEYEGLNDSIKKVGFILCGWNMIEGPYGKWPRKDSEYDNFAEIIEHIIINLKAKVFLLSHNNGFIPEPNFKIIEGRDHLILRQLMKVLKNRQKVNNFTSLKSIYNAAETKSIIGKFDMLITGRIHAAVSGFTQFIPTVIIDYGHEPKAHKLKGFGRLVGMEDYLADPADVNDMIWKVNLCWKNRDEISKHLKTKIPEVQNKARNNFELIKKLFPAKETEAVL